MAIFKFAGGEFDSDTGELQGNGSRARLRPQPAKFLEHLLQRPGQLVTRAELRRAIWPEGTFVHFDEGLNSCLKQIRAALGGRRSAAACIETLVRRGFRFSAPVTTVTARAQSGHHPRRIRVRSDQSLTDGEPAAPVVARLGAEILGHITRSWSTGQAIVDGDMAEFVATIDPDAPVHLLLAVTVRMADNRLHTTSTLIDARTQLPGALTSAGARGSSDSGCLDHAACAGSNVSARQEAQHVRHDIARVGSIDRRVADYVDESAIEQVFAKLREAAGSHRTPSR